MSPQPQTELEWAQRRARLLEAAHQVGTQVTSILDLDELLPKTVDIICEAYGFYYAGVFLVDESGKYAVLRAGRDEAGKTMLAAGHKLEVGSRSMIGWATGNRQARIALDVGEDSEHFKNPYLPLTRSEMALPLVVNDKVLGAVTVQSVEERAFSDEDILTLQTMADQLAVAINNAYLLKDLERANAQILRAKTYEALTAATTQAIHWIGNKALPMTTAIQRMKEDAAKNKPVDLEDLDILSDSVSLILQVKENLLGPVRDPMPRPALAVDLVHAAAFLAGIPADVLKIVAVPENLFVYADTTQVARALGNLFRNALEAKAKHIQVKIQPTVADQVEIQIQDDGIGIPSDVKDRVWAAFITTKEGHVGLGLPAALLIINQHHGSISLNSIPRKGTLVEVTLPAASVVQVGAEATQKTAVLLVDDDDAWAAHAAQILTQAGHKVVRGLVPQGSPDLVLVDEALAGGSVVAAVDALKAASLANKTIVVSVAPTVESVNRWMQLGLRDVVLKPYSPAEFAGLL